MTLYQTVVVRCLFMLVAQLSVLVRGTEQEKEECITLVNETMTELNTEMREELRNK